MLINPMTRGGLLLRSYVESERGKLADVIRSRINEKGVYAVRDLSLHILDLAENSVRAGAKRCNRHQLCTAVALLRVRVHDAAGEFYKFTDMPREQHAGKARVRSRLERFADIVRALDDPRIRYAIPFP